MNPSGSFNPPTDRQYELNVVQNPVRARMCGFGEKDRRPIDPPPVVRLDVYDEYGNLVEDTEDISSFVCLVTIWSHNKTMDCSVVVNPSSVPSQPSFPSSSVISLNDPSHTRNLVGSTVASAQLLQDLDGHSRTFFIFPDLAVRTEGQFTLRFIFTSLLS
ncbi:hypothetical protein H4R33_006312 [Dimargaris cristalligena]|nr:hypothetical protein H4R33_006312 [Dimargaris cristalligena]